MNINEAKMCINMIVILMLYMLHEYLETP